MHDEFPNDLGITAKEDLSCPNMFKIGDKWMLLCISHMMGCRYYLGDFKDEQFLPESHALMNWQYIAHGQKGRNFGFFFAPESMLTADGRRVMWAWLFMSRHGTIPQGVQSLPRELELDKDGKLLIKPLSELKTLRYDEKSQSDILIKNLENYKLKEMSGDAIEFEVIFKPFEDACELNSNGHFLRSFGMEVLCDENGKNGISIIINPSKKTLSIADVDAPFELAIDEEAILRVFIDNNVIEVFANDRQAIAYAHQRTHPHANNQLCADQGNMPVRKVTSWKMNSIRE
jgi:beta-fructofuranosidase